MKKTTVKQIKPRTRRPSVQEDPSTIDTLKDVNTDIKKVDGYWDYQSEVYQELENRHNPSDDIITISGIVDTAQQVAEDLDWAKEQLEALLDQKTAILEKNRSSYESYEFRSFTKPVLKK